MLQLSGRQMRPLKRSGDPDIPNYRSNWRPENFSSKSMSDFVVIKMIYIFCFTISMSDNPKLLLTPQHTSWVVHWATQDFSLAAALEWNHTRKVRTSEISEIKKLIYVLFFRASYIWPTMMPCGIGIELEKRYWPQPRWQQQFCSSNNWHHTLIFKIKIDNE